MPTLSDRFKVALARAQISQAELARRIKGSEFIVYPDSGHGAVFQYHAEFTRKAQSFLAA